jgi:hypothetical protein
MDILDSVHAEPVEIAIADNSLKEKEKELKSSISKNLGPGRRALQARPASHVSPSSACKKCQAQKHLLCPEEDLQLQVQGCIDLVNDPSQVFPVLRHNVVVLPA